MSDFPEKPFVDLCWVAETEAISEPRDEPVAFTEAEEFDYRSDSVDRC